jgi:5-methylcytosine-specific restriction endonuclease McrA
MAGRSTAQRDQDRAVIRRTKPPCGICGGDIDYSAPYLDPGEFVADHITPLNRGGEDILSNKQAAHRACNRDKSDHIPEDFAPRTFVTTRAW